MAQNLPEFLSTQAFVPQSISSSAPVFNTLQGDFDKIASVGLQKQQMAAQAQAQQAGLVAGKNVNLQLPQGTTSAQRVYNAAALATQKQEVTQDISTNLQQNYNAAQLQPNAHIALQNYTQLTQSYLNDYTKDLSPQLQQYAKNIYAIQSSSHLNTLTNNVVTQTHRQQFGQYAQTQAQLQQSYATQLNQGNVAGAHAILAQKEAYSQAALVNGLITKPEYQAQLNQNEANYNLNASMVNYKLALSEGKGNEFLNNALKNGLPGMTPAESQAAILKLKTTSNQAMTSAYLDKTLVQNAAIDNLNQISNGQQSNARVNTFADNYFPDQKTVMQGLQSDLPVTFATVQNIVSLPASQQQAYIDQHFPLDPNAPLNSPAMQTRQLIERRVASINHQFASDPQAAIQNYGLIQNVQAHANSLIETGANQAVNTQTSTRPIAINPDQASYELQATRLPPDKIQLLTNGEAANIQNQIKNATPAQMVGIYNQLQQQHGAYTPIVMRQLAKNGGMAATATFLIGVPPTTPELTDAQTAFTTSKKALMEGLGGANSPEVKQTLKMQPFGAWQQYENSVQGTPQAGTAKHLTDLQNFLQQVSLAYQYNHPGTSVQEAYQHAWNVSPVSQFNYVSDGGGTVRIPTQYAPSMVQNALTTLRNNLLTTPLAPTPQSALLAQTQTQQQQTQAQAQNLLNTQPIPDPQAGTAGQIAAAQAEGMGIQGGINAAAHFGAAIGNLFTRTYTPQEAQQKRIAGGRFVTTGDNTGVMYVDANGIPVLQKNGKPYGETFAEMLQPAAVKAVKQRMQETNAALFSHFGTGGLR